MGFFSFLSPEQDEAPPDIQKPVRVPKGAKVRQPGKDYSLTDQEWAAEGDDIIPGDNIPKATPEEMDPAGVRRKFSADESSVVQKEQAAVRKVKDILTKQTNSLGGDYGNAQLHQVLDALNKGMLDSGQLTDDVQTILKSKNILPQTAQALASAANDLKLAQAARQQLEAGRSAIPAAEAVSPDVYAGHSEEAFKKAKELRESVKGKGILSQGDIPRQAQNWEAQGKSLQELGEQGQTVNAPPKMEGPTDIKTNLAATGKTEGEFNMAIAGAFRTLEQNYGLDLGDLKKKVAFSVAIRTLLPMLDPSGKVTNELLGISREMRAAPPPAASKAGGAGAGAARGAGGAVEADDPDMSEIREKQRMRRELFQQLNSAPETQNWLSAIAAILLSAVIGSEKAMLHVFGRSSRNGTLAPQLELLNREITEDMQMLREKRADDREVRREAARRMTAKDDRDDQRKWEMSKMMIQHKLIIERNAKRGNPETALMKKLAGDYQRALGIASKFSGEMQNEFADPKDRAAARNNFNHYMRKAAELDEDLRKIGGAVLQEEPEAQE